MIRIHAVILALNEEVFIEPLLSTLYPFCNRISVVTQYDRDWYGSRVVPDRTVELTLKHHDPEGKINLTVRRMPDEAAARNMEMLAFNDPSFKGVMSHGNSFEVIRQFHEAPDYFWILDADEFYDVDTIPAMLDYLSAKKPRGMRVTGYNYLRTWNHRVPRSVIDFTHFGFLRPGILFEQRRVVSWNESRFAKGFKMIRFPDLSAQLFGFISCPETVAVFHHGCWLGDNDRIKQKFMKSSHRESADWPSESVDRIKSEFVPTEALPVNIQRASWPKGFFDE